MSAPRFEASASNPKPVSLGTGGTQSVYRLVRRVVGGDRRDQYLLRTTSYRRGGMVRFKVPQLWCQKHMRGDPIS